VAEAGITSRSFGVQSFYSHDHLLHSACVSYDVSADWEGAVHTDFLQIFYKKSADL